jgi:two-component system OmpR family response regulator
MSMERTPHILVVDDHRDIRDLLARFLTKHGLRASVADSAAAARRALQAADVDLVVLDIMMPGEDGLSLTRSLRENTDIPVILLTAMGEETDRIVGLEVGADDYLAKPFNPRELLARIKAVLRRAQTLPRQREAKHGRLAFDRWVLDLGRRELVDDNNVAVPLSSGEFRLLAALLERPGMVLTRDQLLDLTRGRSAQPFDRSIDNQISRLRKKIEHDPRAPRLIKTAWGDGYSFAAEVKAL